jgi:microcin C transport system substrate-binding protein
MINQVGKQLNRFAYVCIFLLILSLVTACGDKDELKTSLQKSSKETNKSVITNSEEYITEGVKLPEDIKWVTNNTDPVFASLDAKKGGTLRSAVMSFPLTFRVVGPDSNSSFRSAILSNQLGLIGIHPNTENIIPELATHWAFAKDKKTMCFRLNKKARWSDGKPVTADDFAYTLEFMRSKHIVAPWYNDYYTNEIEKVVVYDDYTLAVVATKAQPDLHLRIGLNPTPRHFYGELDNEFVNKYNWKIVPNTGPYQISDFQKAS